MRFFPFVILVIITKTLWCQSLPNAGFEDWHTSYNVLNPDAWETSNEPSLITVERVKGYSGEYAAQINVLWDEVVKSFSESSLSLHYSFDFPDHLQALSGFYKGESGTFDSLVVMTKLFKGDQLIQMGFQMLGDSNGEWLSFHLPFQIINENAKPEQMEISFHVMPDERSQGISQFTIDELKLIK